MNFNEFTTKLQEFRALVLRPRHVTTTSVVPSFGETQKTKLCVLADGAAFLGKPALRQFSAVRYNTFHRQPVNLVIDSLFMESDCPMAVSELVYCAIEHGYQRDEYLAEDSDIHRERQFDIVRMQVELLLLSYTTRGLVYTAGAALNESFYSTTQRFSQECRLNLFDTMTKTTTESYRRILAYGDKDI